MAKDQNATISFEWLDVEIVASGRIRQITTIDGVEVGSNDNPENRLLARADMSDKKQVADLEKQFPGIGDKLKEVIADYVKMYSK